MLCLVTQSCPTLCDPMDCSPPGSFVHGDSLDKNTRGGLSCPPPEDLPNPEIEHRSPALQANSLQSEPPGKPVKLLNTKVHIPSSRLQVHKADRHINNYNIIHVFELKVISILLIFI